MEFQLTVLENKRTFMKRVLMHCKARQILRDLYSTNQGNGSEIIFMAGATIIKNLKIYLFLNDLMQARI